MNPYIIKLQIIAGKKKRHIIGLMSGTSLDGLDIAHCTIEGSGKKAKVNLEHFITVPYNAFFKKQVKEIFAKPQIPFEQLCLLHAHIAQVHAAMVKKALKQWKIKAKTIDLIASHGQTVFHAPKNQHKKKNFGNATLQIGDGDQLAVKTGIITLSDFRQKHIAAGGEGAPLAAYGDYLLFSENGKNIVLLNIGGIANFTCLYANGKIISSDTGPGNILMDSWVNEKIKIQSFDKNAALALKGKILPALLKQLMQHPYFKLPFSKTTGPEIFNTDFIKTAIQKAKVPEENLHDILATLNRFTAETITAALNKLNLSSKTKLYVSGGGLHNPLLMQNLKILNPIMDFRATTEKNILPDAKEAVLFALLANETLCGNTSVFKKAGKNLPAINMGKISLPA